MHVHMVSRREHSLAAAFVRAFEMLARTDAWINTRVADACSEYRGYHHYRKRRTSLTELFGNLQLSRIRIASVSKTEFFLIV
jgi:hypothetical protein